MGGKLRAVGALLVLALGALILATTGARAAVSGQPEFTAKGASAVAGYFANGLGVNFTHIQGRMGGNGPDGAISHLGVGPSNGAGIGMCDATTGTGLQLGDVNLGGGLMDVDYGVGQFGVTDGSGGNVLNNGDPCQNGVINPTGAVPLLHNIPSSHSVDISILFDGHHSHNGCPAGSALFIAQDLGNPANLKHSMCVPLPPGTVFTEIDAGVVADAEQLSAPASVPLVTFAHLLASANRNAGGRTVHGSFQSIPDWTVFPVVCTNDGLATGTALITEGPFASDHFHMFSGSAVA